MEITSKVMLVTPEMAAKWLANRNPRSLTFDVAQGWVKFLKNNSLPLNI